jgi:undecaprenyl-diphosphatase
MSPTAATRRHVIAAAAALAAGGGRFGRRAALRGLLSVAISSVVSTGVAKRAVRRGRPPRVLGRQARRFGRRPSTSAFPSGHTASAVAFAVGASQELPWASVPLGVTASAVAWSRLRSRRHYPTDILAGAAIGAGVAVATRRLWPVAPRTPADIRPALTSIGVDPTPDGDGLSIVVNPSAGPALRQSPTDALRDALPAAEIIEVSEGLDFGDALRKASLNARALGVSGGDGSINAAAAVADVQDKPLMVIPGGTLNHFARDLGLESVDDAVEAIKEGQAVAVDLAQIAGKTFLNTASFGAYADLVDARERLEHRIGKWPAAFLALVRVLRSGEPVDVELDGQPRKVWLIFIGNCRYRPDGLAPSWRERLDDGQLDIRVVDVTKPYARLRLVLAFLTGGLGNSRVYDAWTARELRVRSRQGPLRLARDGETFDGPEEFVVCKRQDPLRVYVPKR